MSIWWWLDIISFGFMNRLVRYTADNRKQQIFTMYNWIWPWNSHFRGTNFFVCFPLSMQCPNIADLHFIHVTLKRFRSCFFYYYSVLLRDQDNWDSSLISSPDTRGNPIPREKLPDLTNCWLTAVLFRRIEEIWRLQRTTAVGHVPVSHLQDAILVVRHILWHQALVLLYVAVMTVDTQEVEGMSRPASPTKPTININTSTSVSMVTTTPWIW